MEPLVDRYLTDSGHSCSGLELKVDVFKDEIYKVTVGDDLIST